MINRFNRDNPPDEATARAQDYFYRAIEDWGVEIESYVTTDDGIGLTFSVVDGDKSKVNDDLEFIVSSYVGIQDWGGVDLGTLEVTAHGEDGGTASWRLDPEWAEKYHSGEWKANRVTQAVTDTREGA